MSLSSAPTVPLATRRSAIFAENIHDDRDGFESEGEEPFDQEGDAEANPSAEALKSTNTGTSTEFSASEPSQRKLSARGLSTRERPKKPRVYYIDWMRIISIYLVVVFHVIQALDDMVGLWPGRGRLGATRAKDDHEVVPSHQRTLVENFQTSSLMVGMPLFFHISGRAQALGRIPRNLAVLIYTRFMRLLIPFMVCYVVLIPIWMWFSWPQAPEDAQKNLFKFEIWYWTNFTFNPAWLWFLPVLFLVTTLSAPVLQFAEQKQNLDLGIAAVLLIATCAFLLVIGFSLVFALSAVFGPSMALLVSHVFPLPDKDQEETSIERNGACWKALRLQSAAQVFSTVAMVCTFEYDELSEAWEGIPALFFFWGYYVQGYFAERYSEGSTLLFVLDAKTTSSSLGLETMEESEELLNLKTKVRIYQICVALLMMCAIPLAAPIGRRERMLYPAYSASFRWSPEEPANASIGIFHVIGTWAYLGMGVSLGQAYLNHPTTEWFYQHASSSTMVVYIFHWMFLKFVSLWVIDYFGWKGSLFWQMWDPLFLFLCAVCGSLGVYALLLKVPCLAKGFGM